MVTELQLVANRENAKLGGPKSEAGKQAVRLNAVSHGLLTKETLLKGEDAGKLARLMESCMDDYQPATETEVFLVKKMVSCM
jgi:hypothetical protein